MDLDKETIERISKLSPEERNQVSQPVLDFSIERSCRLQVEERVKNEMLRQVFQELVQTISEKCFLKCITKPGSSLTSGEQTCLAKCMDRYLDAMGIVSKTLIERSSVSSISLSISTIL